LVFPAVILLLAALQDIDQEFGARFRIIGDVTYSTYLLHFPLQLLIITLTMHYGIRINYNQPVYLFAFLLILAAISVPTYHFFELPMQKFFKHRLLTSKPRVKGHA
jgi:peptidoglycan/LPS O-acetylase OafA/YrhL